MRRKLLRPAVALAITVLAAEVATRLTGVLETYSEKNFGVYRSVPGSTKPSWFLIRLPSATVRHGAAEFDFPIVTNREGLRDVDHALEKPAGVTRVVALGDSYSEGIGVDFEHSWPQLLQQSLRARGAPIELLQAGVSGSDPFFEHQLLEHRLLRYAPDLVLFLINNTDTCDTIWWGGSERFRADGTTHARPSPWFEPLYRASHLARFFVHGRYDWRMVRRSEAERVDEQARASLVDLFARSRALGQRHGFEVWVGVHPTPDEVAAAKEPFPPSFFRDLAARGVGAANLSPGMREALGVLALHEYSWPIDRHYNARGYAVLAELVERELVEGGLLP
jgi:hypothetical protein